MSKNNVVLNIEDTIRRIDGDITTKPNESAWMVPLLADLKTLLYERGTAPETDLDRELRVILEKHKPDDRE
jgi:hypothetical protein